MPQAIVASAALSQRSWLPRFGLRTLLIFVALFGAGFGYFGHLLRHVTRQRHIVAKIQEASGTVRYDWQLGMGDHLDPITNTDGVLDHFEDLPGGLHRMTRVTRTRTTVQIERLPGPWILRKLLGDDAFAQVEMVDFNRSSHPTDPFEPRLFLGLPKLKVVAAVDRQVCDEWMSWIAQIPQLRVLDLSGNSDASATASGLALLNSARHLEALSMNGDWLTDEAFSGIRDLHQLKQLSIAFAPNITSAIFSDIGQLAELQVLAIVRCKQIDYAGTRSLCNLRNLRILHLIDTSVSDLILDHIAALAEIEWLSLSQSPVGDGRTESITALSNLKMLDLSNTLVGDTALDHVSRLPNLRVLRLGATNVTDAGLPALGRLTQLESLDLWPCNITDDGIMHLRTLTKLRELGIGPHISKEAADNLRAALPDCRIRRINAAGSSGLPDVEDSPNDTAE